MMRAEKKLGLRQEDDVRATKGAKELPTEENNKIYYDPSLTGKGKTYGLLDSLASKQENQKILIAVPSIKLANDYESKLKSHEKSGGVLCEIVNSDKKHKKKDMKTHEHLKASIDKINEGGLGAKILITTHETLRLAFVNEVDGLSGWDLYVDESINLYFSHHLEVTGISASFYKENFNFKLKKLSDGREMYRMEPKEKRVSLLKDIAYERKKDTLLSNEGMKELMAYWSSRCFDTLINKEQKDELINLDNEDFSNKIQLCLLTTVNSMYLKRFKSITILSALFDRTIMAKVFEINGFELVEKKYATDETNIHDNGSRLKVFYAIDRMNSKSYKKQKQKKNSSKDYEDFIVERYMQMIGGAPFIYNANIDSRTKQVYVNEQNSENNADGKGVLVTEIEGLNDYKGYHVALYTSAKNLDSNEAAVLNGFGIDTEYANVDRNQLSAYQFLSRTSIRDKERDEDVHFYVIDKKTAEFIQGLYPDSTIQAISISELDKSKESITNRIKDKNDRKAFYRGLSRFNEEKTKTIRRGAAERFVKICEENDVLDYKHTAEVYKDMKERLSSKK